ncbi:acyclic terpene utilization AtuA family protein [Aliigemmobacter aestuarii]|uniref:Acyclic terpene utilization AtuA family protein n=1 Tax=Aliigemmobacter aestuarii TaxID=1445661 RepID=A0A4S3MS95_9RHOB|nr:acyclic terpene utilization AtuA family protein [Gemmobacter aestuarii]THD85420.1 acyclic terpene utilization AtuA family protein [Gemmobacter aestuarii]
MTRVLIPTGALGLGYDRAALARGIANRPDIIAVDGGSTDSGPSYLGRGVSKYSRASTKAEWRELMLARAEAGVPLVIGTAGTCGADSAVDWLFDITCEIAAETGQRLRVATLKSGQPAARVKAALAAGRVAPLFPAPEISGGLLDACTNIVALAGAEQIAAALQTGADIVIAGRTTDTAIIAALPLMRGDHAGAAWHGAKIGECGAIATTHPATGTIQIDFDAGGFTIEPMATAAAATPYTVSAHMLYENSDPFILHEPGGHLDVRGAVYTPLDGRRVRVEGSQWVPGRYTVKLEGARIAGYQTVALALLRDRRYVAHSREWAADVQARVAAQIVDRMGLAPEEFTLELRLIGMDATLGPLENRQGQPVEVGVLGIVTCPTEAQAAEAGKMLNPYLLHHALTENEPMPTFAFPFSPAEMQRGALYEFCLNHVMELDDPMEAFRLDVHEVGHG